jgi:signal transduction histidine kinase
MIEIISLETIVLIGAASLGSLGVGILIGSLVRRRGEKRSQAARKSRLATKRRREFERIKLSERQRLRTVYELIATLTATLNYQRVLETALDLSMSALRGPHGSADQLVSAVLLFSDNENHEPKLYVGSARGFSRADMSLTLPGMRGLIGETIEEGVPKLSVNVAKDPELGQVFALQSCKAVYCIPLRTGLDTYGVMVYSHPSRDYFSEEHREVLDIIANQAMIAIQNARLYDDLEEEKERMMETQEEARRKLARDLHDGPTQSVAAIAMRVNFARRLMERDSEAASDELYKIEDLARRTTKEIRHMLFTLRPLVLESQGLQAALESMAEKMRETYGQSVLIDTDPEIVANLEISKQSVIFYIAEEAVNNARKHAEADHIWVSLKPVQDDLALLEIEDNGVGFDVGAVDASYEHRGSLGMINLRERTELVNGVFHIESTKGEGTRIHVLIPLNEEAADRLRRRL